MLRSIIAIWTVALALLAVAATSGCNGCLDGEGCSAGLGGVGPDMSMSPVHDLADSCPTQCATACDASTEICYQPSGAAQLPAFCARPCSDDRQCKTGEKCAALFAALQPSICISAGMPHGCGPSSPTWHCDLKPAPCKDAMTAQIPFSDAANQVCGVEEVHCANGCANSACL